MFRKICAVLFYVAAGVELLFGLLSLVGMWLQKVSAGYLVTQSIMMLCLVAAVVFAGLRRWGIASLLSLLAAVGVYIMGFSMVGEGLGISVFFKNHAGFVLPLPFAIVGWVYLRRDRRQREEEEYLEERKHGLYADLLKK